MRKYYLFLLIFLALFPAKLSAYYIVGPDEYSVYSVIIDDWYLKSGDSVAVVRDHTAVGSSLDFLEIELSYVRSSVYHLNTDITNDFKAKNIGSYEIGSYFNSNFKVEIISQREIDNIFERQGAWDDFYTRYQGAESLLTFSRVGFNKGKNQALVYVVTQWGNLAGTGYYILLEKSKDSTWRVDKEIRVRNSWYCDVVGI